MVMGRPNKGLEHVESLDADAHVKERLKAILSTMLGQASVKDASASVGLQPARFGELRHRALQGAEDTGGTRLLRNDGTGAFVLAAFPSLGGNPRSPRSASEARC